MEQHLKIEDYLFAVYVDDLLAEEVLAEAAIDEVIIENTVEEIQEYIDSFRG